jgi:hypothetical protein
MQPQQVTAAGETKEATGETTTERAAVSSEGGRRRTDDERRGKVHRWYRDVVLEGEVRAGEVLVGDFLPALAEAAGARVHDGISVVFILLIAAVQRDRLGARRPEDRTDRGTRSKRTRIFVRCSIRCLLIYFIFFFFFFLVLFLLFFSITLFFF